jgi:hypothetical protein
MVLDSDVTLHCFFYDVSHFRTFTYTTPRCTIRVINIQIFMQSRRGRPLSKGLLITKPCETREPKNSVDSSAACVSDFCYGLRRYLGRHSDLAGI